MSMYHLSLWAHNHKWTSRFLIVGLFYLLNLTGWMMGEQLLLQEVYLTQTHFYIGAAIVLAGYFAYPAKEAKRDSKRFYRFQKSCDALLVGGTFVLVVCVAQPQSLPKPWMGLPAYATSVKAPAYAHPAEKAKHSFFRKATHGLIQWLGISKAVQKKIQKNVHTIMAEYKKASTIGKLALIILTILVSQALAALVVALSCSLACNGSEALAVLVGVLGLGLIAFFSVRVLRHINHRYRRKTPRNAVPAPPGQAPQP